MNFQIACYLSFFHLLSNTTLASSNDLTISEFLASNGSVNVDDIFVSYTDWVEIHNKGIRDIDISDYHLTDNLKNPDKWSIPKGTVIKAGGYYLFWADGRDTLSHCSFKLSMDGGAIGLFNRDKNPVNTISYDLQVSDISMGRMHDTSDTWVYFGIPTPGRSNSSDYSFSRFSTASIPVYSVSSGLYANPVSLSISSQHSDEVIRYSVNGRIPSTSSKLYSSPIVISKNCVIRARTFRKGHLPSRTITATYLIHQKTDLPVLSIAIDSLDLWDDWIGMYTLGKNGIRKYGVEANYFRDWEKPINLEYFENDGTGSGFNVTCALSVMGERRNMYQKSLKVSTKSKLGCDEITYTVFPDKNITQFKALFLRNSGFDDFQTTLLRDGLVTSLVTGKMDIDYLAYKPALLFINGEFWGLYKIREKIDEDYLAANHKIDPANLDILEFRNNVIQGDNIHYSEMLTYLKANNMDSDRNYKYLDSRIDLDEVINYFITEIFACNTDWPANNNKRWHTKTETVKWRWILHDIDAGFGNWRKYDFNHLDAALAENSSQWWNPPWSTFIFRKLMENTRVREEYIQRCAAYMNSVFLKDRMLHFIDSLKDDIATDMPDHIKKWGKDCVQNDSDCADGCVVGSIDKWLENIEILREFARNRSNYVFQHICDEFNLSGTSQLQVNFKANRTGKLFVNGVLVTDSTCSLTFFNGVPIKLKAVPEVGYHFNTSNSLFNGKDSTDLILSDDFVLDLDFIEDQHLFIQAHITRDVTLTKTDLPYLVANDILVDSNAVLTINPGVIIHMNKGSDIIVRGKLIAYGSIDNIIEIQPNTEAGVTSWGSIFFDNSEKGSLLKQVRLVDGSSIPGNSNAIGTISAYNTDITIDSVSITSVTFPVFLQKGNFNISHSTFCCNSTCDMINVKSGTAHIKQCVFYGNNAANTDAVDYDNLSQGTVEGCYILDFTGSNSDGIDLGEGSKDILIKDNFIHNCSDKGVSVGQQSAVTLINNIITQCAMGVGIKDSLSYVNIINNTLYKNEIGVACYEKNVGSGYGNADVVNTILSMCSKNTYICDERAALTFSYSLSDQMKLRGIGNILGDPLFSAPDKMNFFLKVKSPCINTGDPSSPSDPDSSRADIGAKYIPFIEENFPAPYYSVLPTKFIDIYPNPLRHFVTIILSLKDENSYKITITLFNPQGRKVKEIMNTRGNDGFNKIRINTQEYSTGLYFLAIEAGSLRKFCRIVLTK